VTREGFEALYLAYFGPVYRYLLGLSGNDALAQDLTQETFSRAMTGLSGFREECSVRTWLFQIAKHCYLNHFRREKRRGPFPGEDTASTEPSPEALLLAGESALEAHRALHRLKEPYREVFTLRVMGELSFRQIGEILGKSENWACVTYHRARHKLIAELEEKP
jgi:RNA polymerase sigma-70 factor (ECF subfamily)